MFIQRAQRMNIEAKDCSSWGCPSGSGLGNMWWWWLAVCCELAHIALMFLCKLYLA
jgi:hypothetical protein